MQQICFFIDLFVLFIIPFQNTENPGELFGLLYENTDYTSLIALINDFKPMRFLVKLVYLHVLSTNLKARRFYEDRGFMYLRTCVACYVINNKYTDGCIYALYVNGGFPFIQCLYPFFY